MLYRVFFFFFFFNDTATTEIYTLSLHDALPISFGGARALFAVLLLAGCDQNATDPQLAAPAQFSRDAGISDLQNSLKTGTARVAWKSSRRKKAPNPRRFAARSPRLRGAVAMAWRP